MRRSHFVILVVIVALSVYYGFVALGNQYESPGEILLPQIELSDGLEKVGFGEDPSDCISEMTDEHKGTYSTIGTYLYDLSDFSSLDVGIEDARSQIYYAEFDLQYKRIHKFRRGVNKLFGRNYVSRELEHAWADIDSVKAEREFQHTLGFLEQFLREHNYCFFRNTIDLLITHNESYSPTLVQPVIYQLEEPFRSSPMSDADFASFKILSSEIWLGTGNLDMFEVNTKNRVTDVEVYPKDRYKNFDFDKTLFFHARCPLTSSLGSQSMTGYLITIDYLPVFIEVNLECKREVE